MLHRAHRPSLFWAAFTFLLFLTSSSFASGHSDPSSSSTAFLLNSSPSVHRFSNLYGTVLSCADYFSSSSSSIAHHQTGGNLNQDRASSSSSSLPSSQPQFSINGVQFDLRALLRNSPQQPIDPQFQDHLHSLHHNSQQQQNSAYRGFNVTIRWEVRSLSSSTSSSSSSTANYRSSSSSSSSKSPNNVHQNYDFAHDRASLRYSNLIDGTLSFAPFDSGAFVPEIHDAAYRCLLQLGPQVGVLASREVRVQAGKCRS